MRSSASKNFSHSETSLLTNSAVTKTAGAGIGILSTEVSYWLYPKINTLLPGKNKNNPNNDYAFLPEQNCRNQADKKFLIRNNHLEIIGKKFS